jgi:hypothetical protein
MKKIIVILLVLSNAAISFAQKTAEKDLSAYLLVYFRDAKS